MLILVEGDIKLEVINKVTNEITQLPLNKCARPDGFSAEFYKAFRVTLSPILLCMINHSILQAELPPPLYEANIALNLRSPGYNEPKITKTNKQTKKETKTIELQAVMNGGQAPPHDSDPAHSRAHGSWPQRMTGSGQK